MKKILAILIVAIIACTTIGAKNFTVVYLDRSETNLEAMKFLNTEIRQQKTGFKVTYVNSFSKIKNNSDPVVILNTGLSAGVDSRITAYMKTVTDKSKYVMINLYAMQSLSFYEVIPMKDSTLGIDELSAASAEFGRHLQWATQLFALLNGM